MTISSPITVSELNRRIVSLVASASELQNVWITGETSDMRMSGGHCYLEIVDKDPNTGKPLAKIRATIWASSYYRIAAKFSNATGQQLRSDLKVMVLANASFHPLYGLSLNISDINAAYTLGDVMQRRAEMIRRLQEEGIIDINRELPWPTIPQRIAIISAAGAAGYGDFMKHLYSTATHIKFYTRLFPALMQGEKAVASIITALETIALESDNWDCVVIIRGGGATTDLLTFDNYDLAANIAQFPLPVITGIGHDRDRTILGYVAKIDVKTPTDAAQVLISMAEQALGQLHGLATEILRAVTDRLNGCHQQLAYISGALPAAAINMLSNAKNRLSKAEISIAGIGARLRPEAVKLDSYTSVIKQSINAAIKRESLRLDNYSKLLEILSPLSTLRRGYSITRINGSAVSSVANLSDGTILETILADGALLSEVKSKSAKNNMNHYN